MSTRTNEYGQPISEEVPNWTPREPPKRTTLPGRYCSIEPLNAASHGKALYQAYSQAPDGRDWTYVPDGPFENEQEFHEYAHRIEASKDPLHYTVVDNANGTPVGTMSLMRTDVKHGTIEVGYIAFSPLLKRTRISTEAQYILMKYVFETLGYRRYEWKCDCLNAASCKAAERLGFQYDGTFRQAVVYKGRNRDTAWFAIIDKDWSTNKVAMENWLAEENFGADGKQLRSLNDSRKPNVQNKRSTRTNEYGQPIGEEVPNWTPRQPPTRVTLPGRYCTIAPLNAASQGKALYTAYCQAPDNRDWTYKFDGPFNNEQEYLDYAQRIEASQDPLHYTVIDNTNGQPVGTMSLMRIDIKHGVIEVGYITFSTLLKRTRMSTEAQYILMKYVFETLGYRRYEWKCDRLNAPSCRAAKRLGFQYEGTFRQSAVYKGRNWDSAWFAIVDKDWPRNKVALENWLSDENFDADGKQLCSLNDLRKAV